MGRKKISIQRIDDVRVRKVTFNKRKAGLVKKAMELSLLCDCEVALVVFTSENKLYKYASSDLDRIVRKCEQQQGTGGTGAPTEARDNNDYFRMYGDKNGPDPNAAAAVQNNRPGLLSLSGGNEGDLYNFTPKTQEEYNKFSMMMSEYGQHMPISPPRFVYGKDSGNVHQLTEMAPPENSWTAKIDSANAEQAAAAARAAAANPAAAIAQAATEKEALAEAQARAPNALNKKSLSIQLPEHGLPSLSSAGGLPSALASAPYTMSGLLSDGNFQTATMFQEGPPSLRAFAAVSGGASTGGQPSALGPLPSPSMFLQTPMGMDPSAMGSNPHDLTTAGAEPTAAQPEAPANN
jgi:hypothetical protein